jgi:hypothetical protein
VITIEFSYPKTELEWYSVWWYVIHNVQNRAFYSDDPEMWKSDVDAFCKYVGKNWDELCDDPVFMDWVSDI